LLAYLLTVFELFLRSVGVSTHHHLLLPQHLQGKGKRDGGGRKRGSLLGSTARGQISLTISIGVSMMMSR